MRACRVLFLSRQYRPVRCAGWHAVPAKRRMRQVPAWAAPALRFSRNTPRARGIKQRQIRQRLKQNPIGQSPKRIRRSIVAIIMLSPNRWFTGPSLRPLFLISLRTKPLKRRYLQRHLLECRASPIAVMQSRQTRIDSRIRRLSPMVFGLERRQLSTRPILIIVALKSVKPCGVKAHLAVHHFHSPNS